MSRDDETARMPEETIQLVAPGTVFRDGLENVLRAKTGALIVLGYNADVMGLVEGGFSINCDYSPSFLYELAKMDGAIILSDDTKRILYANAHLVPEFSIPSSETGIRHRTAERVAKQTGKLVIAISQRRNVITLYQGNARYVLKDIGVILTKANQAIQTLEKYKSVLSQSFTNLGALEFEELVTLNEVASVIQRIEMVLRIKAEITKYISELGTEGRLVSMQLEELVSHIEDESLLLIKDYCKHGTDEDVKDIILMLRKLSSEELLDSNVIVRVLGYAHHPNVLDETVYPKGYRVLNKIPRLPSLIINNIVDKFVGLPSIITATIEELDEVEGIGAVRARTIKEGMRRIQEQLFIDRHL